MSEDGGLVMMIELIDGDGWLEFGAEEVGEFDC
jgi:hypothetical protein